MKKQYQSPEIISFEMLTAAYAQGSTYPGCNAGTVPAGCNAGNAAALQCNSGDHASGDCVSGDQAGGNYCSTGDNAETGDVPQCGTGSRPGTAECNTGSSTNSGGVGANCKGGNYANICNGGFATNGPHCGTGANAFNQCDGGYNASSCGTGTLATWLQSSEPGIYENTDSLKGSFCEYGNFAAGDCINGYEASRDDKSDCAHGAHPQDECISGS